jgi:HAD superfamily hydrolase (TIGR01509 family)
MPLNISLIQAICFDLDGTLSDTDDIWQEKILPFIRLFHWMSPKTEPNLLARRLVMGIETPGNYMYYMLDRLGMDAFAGRIYNWINRSLSHRTKKYRMVPGTNQTLETLGQRFPMAVVSAGGSSGTHEFLATFGLLSHFKAVATSQTCKHTKPFPDPVIWAAAQMGIDTRNCLMIGDTVVDIHAGKAAGAQTVGVLCGFGKEKELRRAGADLILGSPVELLDVLYPRDG